MRGVIQCDAPPDELLARFKAARARDEALATTLWWLRYPARLGGFVAVLGIGSVFLLAESPASATRVVVAIVGMTGLAIFAVSGALWAYYTRRHTDERKLRSVVLVLTMLRADMAHDERVALTLDLRHFTSGLRTRKQRSAYYRQTWLELTTTLADGNRIRLRVDDHIRQKRKHRGVQTRGFSTVGVAVHFAKRYRPIDRIVARLRRRAPSPLPPLSFIPEPHARGPADGRRLKARFRTRLAATATPIPFDAPAWKGPATAHTLLSLLGWLYRGIARARRAA